MKLAPVSRRIFVSCAGAALAAAYLPKPASAVGARDPRLVVIILRGALDGLSAVAPVADPNYMDLRGALALASSGEHAALPLDGFFVLHPAMPVFARQFREKGGAIIHATATSYRDRSHFDGQDVLESGYPGPKHTESGWLNRAVSLLPAPSDTPLRGLGVGVTAPLVIRGPVPVLGWAAQGVPKAGDELAQRVLDLYSHRDPALGAALHAALQTEEIATAGGMDAGAKNSTTGLSQSNGAAAAAARLLAAPDGPRVAALSFGGFDTHADEGAATGQLATRLASLDSAFEVLEKGLGEYWSSTIVVAITEFGRTAKANGTSGTDHGTATVAFLSGRAVAGGRVIADWPGLKPKDLFQGRDLAPTTDLWAVLKGLLVDHLGLSANVLAETVFPETAHIEPMKGLVER